MTTPSPKPSAPEHLLGLEYDRPDAAVLSTPDEEMLLWANHLAPLYATLPEREPSPALWARVLGSSYRRDRDRGLYAWQALAAALAVLSIGLAIQLTFARRPPVAAPALAAESGVPLTAEKPILTAGLAGAAAEPGRLAFVMATVEGGKAIRSSPATAKPQAGRTYHLWVVAPEYRVFIGVVSPDIQHSVTVPENARALLKDGARLEVSLDQTIEAPFQPGLIVASGDLIGL